MHTGDQGEYLLYLIAIEAGLTSTCTVNGRLNPENVTVSWIGFIYGLYSIHLHYITNLFLKTF